MDIIDSSAQRSAITYMTYSELGLQYNKACATQTFGLSVGATQWSNLIKI